MRKCPNNNQIVGRTIKREFAKWLIMSLLVLSCLVTAESMAQSAAALSSSVKVGSTSLIGWLVNFFMINVFPNIQGALLLLVISTLVSTLTFQSELKRSELSSRGSFRYLILWIFGNYIIALILLVLFLPENKGFNLVDRQFFLYCVVAAAMPELSAYLKVQIGNSKQGINLYKYREMFTKFVSSRVDSLTEQNEWQESYMLKSVFWGRTQELCEKLITFANLSDLTDDDKTAVLACLPSQNQASEQCVDQLFKLKPEIQEKLLNFFRDDVRRYEQSARARLEKKLYPPVSAGEAQQLVTNGIISPVKFFLRTMGSQRRKKLAEATHIDSAKLSLIHHEMRDSAGNRIKHVMMAVVVAFVFLIATTFILGTQMDTSVDAIKAGDEQALDNNNE